jgi:dihydroorotate dehydrogenase (NAD+) catalytic subunit
MGGVQTSEHAAQMLSAGATLVAVGTESFRDPLAAARIAAGIPHFLAKSGNIVY